MIPKIIHLCWLSGEAFPQDIQNCINSWKQNLPDYEVWLWDTKRFDINSTLWTKQAFDAKKYAFVADYIRLYALYTYGGIYLDSDVLVYKSFDDLLDLPYFIGQDYTGTFEAAVIGAEKGMSWIGYILQQYKDKVFIQPDGNYDMLPLPHVFFKILYPKYKFRRIDTLVYYKWDGNEIVLFHKDFFNSRNSIGPHKTKRSYCTHHYAGAWTSEKTDVISRIKRILPLCFVKFVYDISHMTYKKAKVHRFDPIYNSKHLK